MNSGLAVIFKVLFKCLKHALYVVGACCIFIQLAKFVKNHNNLIVDMVICMKD